MLEDNLLPFSFPAVERKKVTAAFDGGRITSDGGVMLLAAVEKELGIAERLAPLITDPRNPLLVTHSVADATFAVGGGRPTRVVAEHTYSGFRRFTATATVLPAAAP